jgi:hypothetical protein
MTAPWSHRPVILLANAKFYICVLIEEAKFLGKNNLNLFLKNYFLAQLFPYKKRLKTNE